MLKENFIKYKWILTFCFAMSLVCVFPIYSLNTDSRDVYNYIAILFIVIISSYLISGTSKNEIILKRSLPITKKEYLNSQFLSKSILSFSIMFVYFVGFSLFSLSKGYGIDLSLLFFSTLLILLLRSILMPLDVVIDRNSIKVLYSYGYLFIVLVLPILLKKIFGVEIYKKIGYLIANVPFSNIIILLLITFIAYKLLFYISLKLYDKELEKL